MDTLATFEPIRRRAAANGDEADAFSVYSRRALTAFGRAGVAAKTKTRAARRARHEVRQALHGSRDALAVQLQLDDDEWFLATATL